MVNQNLLRIKKNTYYNLCLIYYLYVFKYMYCYNPCVCYIAFRWHLKTTPITFIIKGSIFCTFKFAPLGT